MAFWDTISLAFEFVPKIPTIERGAARLRDDAGFMALVADVPKVHDTYARLVDDPDVAAMVQVFKDLFKALAIDGGSTSVAQVLVDHGAPPDAVNRALAQIDSAAGNPDANNGGSDNANGP